MTSDCTESSHSSVTTMSSTHMLQFAAHPEVLVYAFLEAHSLRLKSMCQSCSTSSIRAANQNKNVASTTKSQKSSNQLFRVANQNKENVKALPSNSGILLFLQTQPTIASTTARRRPRSKNTPVILPLHNHQSITADCHDPNHQGTEIREAKHHPHQPFTATKQAFDFRTKGARQPPHFL